MDKSVHRIHFYTKKIAQLSAIHPTRRNDSWYKRAERLKCYKKAMHEQF